MDIPDDLLCLYSGRIEERADSYVIEVPERELEYGDVEAGEVYRIALLPGSNTTAEADTASVASGSGSREAEHEQYPEPPVDEGDVRTVEIEGIGDQGDGIARVDRGYVVIVPETEVGDEVTVEIEETRQNFAMARVVED